MIFRCNNDYIMFETRDKRFRSTKSLVSIISLVGKKNSKINGKIMFFLIELGIN